MGNKLSGKCMWCESEFEFDESKVGKIETCPKCNRKTTYRASTKKKSIEKVIHQSAPKQLQSSAPKQLQSFKANRSYDGNICFHCTKTIDLGDDIVKCDVCDSVMHTNCYYEKGHCSNPDCSESNQNIASSPKRNENDEYALQPLSAEPETNQSNEKECPFCGEMIKSNAKICRFCGETIDRMMRRRKEQQKSNPTDENLSALEVIFAILCGIIPIIVGIVWMAQGKKKGWKLLAISIIVQVFFAILQVALFEE